MKYCPNCDDWAENIEAISGPVRLAQIRSGKQAHFKPFVYCPWCGAELVEKPTQDDAIEGAIEESDRISRELDDAGRLRQGQLDEEINK